MIFSLTPPTDSTLPRRVISPVIATSWRTGRPESSEARQVATATPAEGPSLGIEPAGKWMCTSSLLKVSSAIPRAGARERTYE
jgi:hypothetical protein